MSKQVLNALVCLVTMLLIWLIVVMIAILALVLFFFNVEDCVELYLESRETHFSTPVSQSQSQVLNTSSCQMDKRTNQSKFLSWSDWKKRSHAQTDYLKILAENKQLSMLLSQFVIVEPRETHSNHTLSFTNILKQIFINTEKNLGKYPTSHI